MIRPGRKTVVVAAGQIQSRLMNEAPATLESIGEMIREAARQAAQLLVLPECAYPAYLLGSVESYRTGDHLSSRQFVEWLAEQAARHQLHIVSGYVEDTGEALFNAALLIGPDGRTLGQARKRFLWHADQDWFRPGEEIAAIPTELGRIGIIICAEARVPEIIATLAADGAELIAMPTCWINTSRQPGEYRNPQPEFLIAARAREFGVPFVCADKCGLEMTMGYVGQSCVAKPETGVVAMAPSVGESLVVAEIEIGPPAPVWIPPARRSRLLDPAPAISPGRTTRCELTVAAVSTELANARLNGQMGENLFKPLAEQGTGLMIVNLPHEATAERASMFARAFDMEAIGFPVRPNVFTAAGARVGTIAGQWLRSFATGRALALEGAEVLVYFDAADDLAMLRTRAVENRVFVVGVDAAASTIVGPDGTVLARGTAEAPAIARVDLADASDKTVAPRTDIFAQRPVKAFRF
ncbi:MAG TPA: nitrilase-related carbon-nitrogen hydrolase [Phycisphaerae bacterium]|nr:nitrilase-related carbon-nitrogen hydrolase [Phycisphaerae bacterium]HOJ72640.1 nitrilase-related carbon-nitrogen hydrolase [Phycisphaerae bacterium]HOM49699.1 nitrilase-related carbon-nitrogen hydrolase [Phycisphaerae bacterium]HOQ85135.1 nitrilase-related carbon-nitrogen hydrolase [Phycisphaerae bacterium]HPP25068.1 nitrilase-related carbon-nitrogen hydrolase [Phycisphaerae bacterium]